MHSCDVSFVRVTNTAHALLFTFLLDKPRNCNFSHCDTSTPVSSSSSRLVLSNNSDVTSNIASSLGISTFSGSGWPPARTIIPAASPTFCDRLNANTFPSLHIQNTAVPSGFAKLFSGNSCQSSAKLVPTNDL